MATIFIAAAVSYGQCSSPCQSFTSGSGLSYPSNSSQNNVAWASVTVPTNAFATGTAINHITVTLSTWTENSSERSGLDREFLLQGQGGQTFEFAAHVPTDNAFICRVSA